MSGSFLNDSISDQFDVVVSMLSKDSILTTIKREHNFLRFGRVRVLLMLFEPILQLGR